MNSIPVLKTSINDAPFGPAVKLMLCSTPLIIIVNNASVSVL